MKIRYIHTWFWPCLLLILTGCTHATARQVGHSVTDNMSPGTVSTQNLKNRSGLPSDPSVLSPNPAGDLSYDQREDAQQFAKELAQTSSLNVQDILNTLAKAHYQPSVVKAIAPTSVSTGAAPVKNWQKYRARFVEPHRIQGGVAFWNAHEASLNTAQAQTGVPASVIVAIIGVETVYGENTGNYRALDALSTLAFDYPKNTRDRSEFFKRELAALFLLSQETHRDILSIKGSYAGAVGLGQFMPSSWRQFAVDGDGDGIVDLMNDADDAIASVGNFLQKHGWVREGLWYMRVNIDNPGAITPLLENDVTPNLSVSELEKWGIHPLKHVDDDEKFALIDLPTDTDVNSVEYRLGTQNFFAVTRYNRSSFYAMSVMELAESIEAARTAQKMMQERLMQEKPLSINTDPPDHTQ